MRRTGFVGDRSGHQVWLVAALLVVVLLLAGCGPRIGTTAPPQAAEDALVVDLPMIYIDFDADGQATLGGIPVSELGAALGSDLSSISMEPDTIARLQNANLQHVQLATRPDGVAIFINSAAAPSLVWDEQTLESLVATLNDLGTDLGEAGALLPLVRDFGLNLVHFSAVLRDGFSGLGSGKLGRGAVFVGGADEHHLMPPAAQIARIEVGRQLAADEVAQMLHPVDVGNGRGDQMPCHARPPRWSAEL